MQWVCYVTSCATTFANRQDLHSHLTKNHSQQPEELVVDQCKRATTTLRDQCPFCPHQVPVHHLKNHVGHHLIHIALFTLPQVDLDTDNNSSKPGKAEESRNSSENRQGGDQNAPLNDSLFVPCSDECVFDDGADFSLPFPDLANNKNAKADKGKTAGTRLLNPDFYDRPNYDDGAYLDNLHSLANLPVLNPQSRMNPSALLPWDHILGFTNQTTNTNSPDYGDSGYDGSPLFNDVPQGGDVDLDAKKPLSPPEFIRADKGSTQSTGDNTDAPRDELTSRRYPFRPLPSLYLRSPQAQSPVQDQPIASSQGILSQLIGGSRASISGPSISGTSTRRTSISTSRASTSRASNTRASVRGVSKARKTWPCTVCSKTFKDASKLRDHMLTHSPEQPFRCTDCNRGFRRERDMNLHKKYKCPSTRATCAPTRYGTRKTRDDSLVFSMNPDPMILDNEEHKPWLFSSSEQPSMNPDPMILDNEEHKPWLFPSSEQPANISQHRVVGTSQQIMYEFDDVPQGGDIDLDLKTSSRSAGGNGGADPVAVEAVMSPPNKISQTNTPWTPQEKQRLMAMRDAGNSWSEIAKTFPTKAEGSVKKVP